MDHKHKIIARAAAAQAPRPQPAQPTSTTRAVSNSHALPMPSSGQTCQIPLNSQPSPSTAFAPSRLVHAAGNIQYPQGTPMTPPPAYTPMRNPVTYALAPGVWQLAQDWHNQAPRIAAAPTPVVDMNNTLRIAQAQSNTDTNSSVSLTANDDDYDGSASEFSPIEMHIYASVHVKGNNNVVLLDASPSTRAESIAVAVSKALSDHSAGRCGIPMIDEDGRPRPISVKAEAGMNIEGSGNLVGNGELLVKITQSEYRRCKRAREEADEGEPANKRSRSASS